MQRKVKIYQASLFGEEEVLQNKPRGYSVYSENEDTWVYMIR